MRVGQLDRARQGKSDPQRCEGYLSHPPFGLRVSAMHLDLRSGAGSLHLEAWRLLRRGWPSRSEMPDTFCGRLLVFDNLTEDHAVSLTRGFEFRRLVMRWSIILVTTG